MLMMMLFQSGGDPEGPFIVSQRFRTLEEAGAFLKEQDAEFEKWDGEDVADLSPLLSHWEGCDVVVEDQRGNQWYDEGGIWHEAVDEGRDAPNPELKNDHL